MLEPIAVKPNLDTLEYLLQLDIIGEQLPAVGKDQWQTLYLGEDEPAHRLGIYCALLEAEAAREAIGRDGWDLMIGDGAPGFSQGWRNGEATTTYQRRGGLDRIR